MKQFALFGIFLLSSALGCSRQPPREPVTVTFLDIEYDTPDQLPADAWATHGHHLA